MEASPSSDQNLQSEIQRLEAGRLLLRDIAGLSIHQAGGLGGNPAVSDNVHWAGK